MDLEKLMSEFLEYLEIEKNVSLLTIRNYRHYLNRFLGFLTAYSPTPSVKTGVKSLPVSTITPEAIRQFRLHLARFADEKGLTLNRVTQNYHLIAIRSFLKYLTRRDLKVLAPETIELPKAESHRISFLDHDQV